MDGFVSWVVRHRIVIGVVLFGLGLGTSVLLAFGASSADPPDGAQSALLVIISGLFNVGGAWAVSRRPGGPNLTGSQVAVRHLAKITTDVGKLAQFADEAFEGRPAGKNREDVGQLSWKLSDIESRLITNLEDWAKVYPDLIENGPSDASGQEPEEQ
ncbi:hypothetical protein [Microbacterium sp. NIBRBAC000506063]|uniref:hypothetical protein n=1 Tax=Microbacterium sp. NIBRBAC000506063 TaxID=2734618 RepID=UPI001BB48A68|nr:hypothetical protein [Microbacterium sp. NIBRBAC000506063]QTV79263.1 hypothetical protein KAE78_09510 [Microbacterium sp. NIBRBAC000506063]